MNQEIEKLLQQGMGFYQTGRLDEAEKTFLEIIRQYPNHGDAYNILGSLYAQHKNFPQAFSLFENALKIDPSNAVYNSNFGNVLQDMGRIEESLQYYNKAIGLDPFLADAYFNLSNALRKLQRHHESLEYLKKVKKLDPRHVKSYVNTALVYNELKQTDLAFNELQQALDLEPNSYDVLSNLAVIYALKKDYPNAVNFFKRAYETGKADAKFYVNYATVCTDTDNRVEGIRAYLKAAEMDPASNDSLGRALHQKMILADWSNVDDLNREIVQRLKLGQEVADPFGYMGFSDSEQDLQRAATNYLKLKFPVSNQFAHLKKHPRHKKIRLGYVSGEFREHANGSLMTGLIECHDKSRFEVVAFDNGRGDASDLRRRLLGAFDEFIDINKIGDLDLTQQIREKEIDILFNLNGFFGEHRTGIFANRSAPIQINFLGCPGTMGVEYMDYLIADSVVIPKSSYQYYNEKIISLPHSYQINDSRRPEIKKTMIRKDCGLPEGAFVFCCFNNIYKVTPITFRRWIKILLRVPGSVLWFYNNFPEAAANLRREAQVLGVDPSRLIFSPYVAMYDHLERYHVADLFLDSLPYNAHTSGSDALWANLPVLTLQGKSFAGRVGASLLHAIKMPELVTYTEQEFEDKAVDLATHPEKLASLKVKLAKNRLTTPLFDTKLYTQHFESALIEAYERYQSDLPPAHIEIKP
jgi:predicted O-linked N-acetylglucosamine transferase (SPINDLY family)